MNPIWLLDRSRVQDGRGFCARSRALGYHLGPTGMGITLKGTRLPLMTGIAGHDGLAPILQWCVENDEAIQLGLNVPRAAGETRLPVPEAVVRAAIGQAQAAYQQVVTARGFAYLEPTDEQQALVREQQYLIEGLIWAWCLEVLPEILTDRRILEVEHDDTYVFACTCGLGSGIGTKTDHEARDCGGMGLMCRPDFIDQHRLTGECAYHEFKTTSTDGMTFRDKWEVMMQMFAATLEAEQRLGIHIQSVYVHGLVKGRREGEYNFDTGKKDGAYRQQSIFCYGYRKPANPPMEQEEWSAQYEYQDAEGKNRRLGKLWKKAGVWELPDALVPAGQSKAEVWVKWMPAEVRRKNLILIGPLTKQSQMVEHFLAECEGEEGRWQAGLWQLHDLALEILAAQGETAGWWACVWPDARFQRLLDQLFPRSYECRRYGQRNRCQFEDICLEREGHVNPVGSGRFIDRRPHHADELAQAIARGLILPEAGMAEEGEEG